MPLARVLVTATLVLGCSSPKHEEQQRVTVGTGDAGHPLTSPETDCASCHPKQVDEWKVSSHAYSMKDPVFHAMVRLGQKETNGVLDDFCVKCHSPIGNLTGQTVVSKDPATGFFTQKTTGLDSAATDGVSCIVCHSMSRVTKVANAGFELALGSTVRGPISDPAKSPVHDSAFSALYDDTEMCGTCHVVVNPKNVALENTHIEWVQSIFNGMKTCQDCHMPSTNGQAAVGGPDRKVHDHRFVGVDVSLLPPDEFAGYDDFRERVGELLRNSTEFSATADETAKLVRVDIKNLAGHSIPSGATADREMWVEFIVQNDAGQSVLESGTLDEGGNLRVTWPERTTRPGSDPQLILYTQEMLDDPRVGNDAAPGEPKLVDFLWEPNAERSHLIRAEEISHRSYDVSSLAPGKYTAKLRLLFRSFAPHLLRKLEAEADLSPEVAARVPTTEMATASVEFSIAPN